MIGIYDYTALFTFFGTICGILSIYFTLTGNIAYGVLLLLISGFFDSMDGFVARSKKKRSEFEKNYGVQLDSLSDVICFGVAPTMLAFQISSGNVLLQVLSFIYMFAAISRLAWFNVDEMMRRTKESGARQYYTGLPVTPASLIFPTIFMLREVFKNIFPYFYIGVLLVVSFFQLSKLQIPHLKWKGQLVCTIYGIIVLILLILTIL